MKKLRCGGKREDYPANWEAVSHHVRFERARGRCECAGECGVAHGGRCPHRHEERVPRSNRRIGRAKVVLATAHVCLCVPLCADPKHLKAMCQGCHIRHDTPKHAKNAAKTRMRKRGQLALPVLGEVFR
jgi:hypothetical protein